MSFYIENQSYFRGLAEITNKDHMLLPANDLDFLISFIKATVPKGSMGLEVGTFVGQTAAALASNGFSLVTLENNPKYATLAKQAFIDLKLNDHIELIYGSALESMIKQSDEFWKQIKFVFVDANKGGYLKYYKFLASHCCLENAVLIFDNVFLNGRVAFQVKNSFSDQFRNHLGLTKFKLLPGIEIKEFQFENETDVKQKSPDWSEAVRGQMIKLCQLARDQYQGILIDTSDGMLIFSRAGSLIS